jgi:hypothetical protein
MFDKNLNTVEIGTTEWISVFGKTYIIIIIFLWINVKRNHSVPIERLTNCENDFYSNILIKKNWPRGIIYINLVLVDCGIWWFMDSEYMLTIEWLLIM